MSDVETLFVSWPVGLALSCWLFFEIATRSSRVGQLLVPRRVVARSQEVPGVRRGFDDRYPNGPEQSHDPLGDVPGGRRHRRQVDRQHLHDLEFYLNALEWREFRLRYTKHQPKLMNVVAAVQATAGIIFRNFLSGKRRI